MSRRKLLLADDSITIQKVVNLTFADEGIDVVTVGDGDAALAHLASQTPDILLADVNMPGPTGYQICEQLRSNDATKDIPVILLVGSFEPFDEAEAARVGANAYLTKPFQSIKQLIAQVNELIDASKPSDAELSAAETVPLAAVPAAEIASEAFPAADQATEIEPEVLPADVVEAAPRYFDDLGYETSVEQPPIAAQPPDDIDDLYKQSIDGGPEDLADVGIDDEMIETSYSSADPNSELAAFNAANDALAVEEPVQEFSDSPYDTADLAEEPEYSAPVAEVPTPVEQETPDTSMDTVEYHNWRPADMRDEPVQPTSYETTQLNPDAIGETPAPPAEAFPETPQAEETPAQSYDGPTEPAPFVAPKVGEDTIRMDERFDTSGSPLKFDDVDLLDLSASPETPVVITSPVNAIEQGSSKQIVTLSPELIEMIAQRVVEKLSEKY